MSAPLTTSQQLASQLISKDRAARRGLALAVVLGAASLVAGLGLLVTSAWLLTRAWQQPPIAALSLAIVGVRFFALTRGVLRYRERLVGHDAAFRVLGRMRVRVYRHLDRLAPFGAPEFRRGDLLARIVADVDSLQAAMLRVAVPIGVSVVSGAAAVVVAGWLFPPAGAVLFCVVIGAWALVPVYARRARRTEAYHARLQGDLHASIVDLLDGADELVLNGTVAGQLHRIDRADRALSHAEGDTARASGMGEAATLVLCGLAVVATIAVSAGAARSGRLDAPVFAALALLPLAVVEVAGPLPPAAQAQARARRHGARIDTVLAAHPVVTDPAAPRPLPEGPYSLRLHEVGVRYPGSARLALEGMNLTVGPGDRIAVVGPSGAGKSTLAHALVRFLPHTGVMTLNGVDVDAMAGDDVRRVIGMVAQDAYVFDTTLRENLLLARRDASDDELCDALARVGLLDVVDGLPGRLDCRVGESGSRLSGGQRQRLAVARALVARFPLLVLDEPAEHLDQASSESLTTELLWGVGPDRSVILITHRLCGLEHVDEILVLDGGSVVERGSHAALIESGGWYARRYEDQSTAPWSPLDERVSRLR